MFVSDVASLNGIPKWKTFANALAFPLRCIVYDELDSNGNASFGLLYMWALIAAIHLLCHCRM